MSFASMTGFALCEGEVEGAAWAWEVKSVNARGLDLRCRLPAGLGALEAEIRARVKKRFRRGNFTLALSLERPQGGIKLCLNQDVVDQAAAIIESLGARLETAAPRLDGLLRMPGLIETREAEETGESRERRHQAVFDGLDEVLAALAAMRGKEGSQLEKVVTDQLDMLEGLCKSARSCASAQPAALMENLKSKIKELAQSTPPLSDERLAQEAALLAIKSDVREELDRLEAHIWSMRELAARNDAVGRQLDFLCQEMNRETNTVCSKSSDLELTRIGLELKSVVDQIREQVQNIE